MLRFTVRLLRLLEKHLRYPTAGACLYEATAILVPQLKLPTWSALIHKYKWAYPLFCGIVGLHFWFMGDED